MEAKKLTRILSTIKFILAITGVLLCISLFGAPNVTEGAEKVAAYRDGSGVFSATIWFTFLLIFALMAIVLVFFFVDLISNPKKTVISIGGILIFLIIYMVINVFGTTDTNETLALRNPVSQGVIGTTTAGIYTILVGMIISLVVILAGPFMGRFRK